MKTKVTAAYTKVMFALVGLIFFGAIIRLVFISLSIEVDNFNLSAYAQSRNTVSQALIASRGNILDSSGELLAQTINTYTLIAYLEESRTKDTNNPMHVVDIEKTADCLSSILNLEKDELIKKLSKDKYQVELAKDITEYTKAQINELDLNGLDFINTTDRYYPNGSFASYLIGYAKKNDKGKINGELGIEGYYNSLLTGIDGSTTYQKDAFGYTMPNTPSYTKKAISGHDIYLTIDSSVQLILENAIAKIEETEGYDWSIISVMDAKTGAIVGSATTPDFNPNDLNTIEDNYLNPLVSYQFEPGSTMKTFSFAAAIEEGIYEGDKIYKSGSIDVTDRTIRDSNKIGWGDITFDTGYAYSSNVAATLLALDLGVGTLTDYYKKLGFSSPTGIELSNEYKGAVNFLYDVELANAAFGQGISVTPIQILQAYTCIANNGVMLKPYIVDKIVDEKGEIYYENTVKKLEKVYSDKTVEKIKELMHNAVYKSTSTTYVPDNITIIGKSGTAQIAGDEGYLKGPNDYIKSFVAIMPEDEPKYIFYIATSKYQKSYKSYGEIITTAIEEIASYANITDNEVEIENNKKIVTQNYISLKTEEVKEKLSKENLNTVIIGNGNYIINQFPPKDSKLYSKDKLFLITNSTQNSIIELKGYSMADLKRYCKYSNLECKINGYGYVDTQSLEAGHTIVENDILEVNLK